MPATPSLPRGFQPSIQAILPDPDGVEVQRNFELVQASIATLLPYIPQPATSAPKSPVDGMVRLARAPWRPIGGTTDQWVSYNAASAAWRAWTTP